MRRGRTAHEVRPLYEGSSDGLTAANPIVVLSAALREPLAPIALAEELSRYVLAIPRGHIEILKVQLHLCGLQELRIE